MARTPICLATAVVALSLGGCLGDRAADRTLTIYQLQSTDTNGTAAWGARVWADRSGRRNSESAQTGNAARHRVLCGVGEISAV